MAERNEAQTLWAWVTRTPDGSVSQVGALVPQTRMHQPLISNDRAVMEGLRPLARSHARQSGQKVWLREYTGAIDHEDA